MGAIIDLILNAAISIGKPIATRYYRKRPLKTTIDKKANDMVLMPKNNDENYFESLDFSLLNRSDRVTTVSHLEVRIPNQEIPLKTEFHDIVTGEPITRGMRLHPFEEKSLRAKIILTDNEGPEDRLVIPGVQLFLHRLNEKAHESDDFSILVHKRGSHESRDNETEDDD